MKKREYYELTAFELAKLIEEHYGRLVDVYSIEGVHYGTILVFDVSDKMTRFEITDVANFVGRQHVPNVTRALLVSLCEKRLIPAGRYIVTSAL